MKYMRKRQENAHLGTERTDTITSTRVAAGHKTEFSQTWRMTQEARVPIVLSNAQIEATDFGTSVGRWGR